MNENTKGILVSLVVGAGAGALVGFGVWWYASRRLEQGFQSGLTQMAGELGVGSAELRAQLAAGTTEIRQELARQVEAQVRPAVATEVRNTLSRYNITPETGQRISQTLAAADRLGLI